MMNNNLLLVDHRDSFSNNLRAALEVCGFKVCTVQSSDLTPAFWDFSSAWSAVVFSPGPSRPEHYPNSLELYRKIPAHVAVLGVCLGHQLMLHADGGRVEQTVHIPVHGRQISVTASASRLLGANAFSSSAPLNQFVLYNSLAVSSQDPVFQKNWHALATDHMHVLVAEHRTLPRIGIQFHPESFASPGGPLFLRAFAQFVNALPSM